MIYRFLKKHTLISLGWLYRLKKEKDKLEIYNVNPELHIYASISSSHHKNILSQRKQNACSYIYKRLNNKQSHILYMCACVLCCIFCSYPYDIKISFLLQCYKLQNRIYIDIFLLRISYRKTRKTNQILG